MNATGFVRIAKLIHIILYMGSLLVQNKSQLATVSGDGKVLIWSMDNKLSSPLQGFLLTNQKVLPRYHHELMDTYIYILVSIDQPLVVMNLSFRLYCLVIQFFGRGVSTVMVIRY